MGPSHVQLFLAYLLCASNYCEGQDDQDMFSSTSEMAKLALWEREATDNLRKLKDLMEKRIEEVKSLMPIELPLMMQSNER